MIKKLVFVIGMLIHYCLVGQSINQIPNNSPLIGVTQASASVVGKPGITPYYYWIIAKFATGNAVPYPVVVERGPNVLSGSNYIRLNWQNVTNATGYDVIKSTSPTLPSSGNIALATNLVTNTVNDQNTTLTSYTVSTLISVTQNKSNLISGAGTPSSFCSTGDLYVNTATGATTLIYSCQNSAWVALLPSSNTGATSVTNDTNVTGNISNNVLTLGWVGTLAKTRLLGTTVFTDQSNTFTSDQTVSSQNLNITSSNTSSTNVNLTNTSTGGHSYQFYSTGSTNGQGSGLFGVYDSTTDHTIMAMNGNNNSIATSADGIIGFTSANRYASTNNMDTYLTRNSAGILRINSSGTNGGDLQLRHIVGSSGVPTLALNANAGSGATASLTRGSDISGAFTITSGTTSLAAGTVITITFATAYPTSALPTCLVTASAAASANNPFWTVTLADGSGFSIAVANAYTASNSYPYRYTCIS